MQVPTPEQFAQAGPWAAFAFLAVVVIVGAFWLLRLLLARELKRADAAEAELKETKTRLDQAERLLRSYEVADDTLRRSRQRDRDDA